ncbi:MAG: hypothetical protein GXO40_00495 [Epsilonproteobacteria bacterium]|nr:hypothetical protein [Campylobacterota bacterium]
MDIKELEQLKNKLFSNDEELEKMLKSVANELLNSKIKEESLSPILLTHKEFIDVSLKRFLKKIREKVIALAAKKNLITDKIFEIKLEYLAAYLLKYDMKKNNVLYKTIAKYIIKLIRKDPLKLNYFVSTLNRRVYAGQGGKFEYPILYPFDKNRYNNPIPEIKSILNKYDTIKKMVTAKEDLLHKYQQGLDEAKLELEQIKKAAIDMKDIANKLKQKYEQMELNLRLWMLKNQHARFNVLIIELKEKIQKYSQQVKALTKNVEGLKQKYKDILSKEDEIIETLAQNLKTSKRLVVNG